MAKQTTRGGVTFTPVASAEKHYTAAGKYYVKAHGTPVFQGKGGAFEGFAIHELVLVGGFPAPGKRLVPYTPSIAPRTLAKVAELLGKLP